MLKMKQINKALASAISLMLFSSYSYAQTYDYNCSPDDSFNNECCDSQVTSCGSNTAPFNSDSSGTSDGGGKHQLEPTQTKYMKLTCEEGMPVHSYEVWNSGGGSISCTMDGGIEDESYTITLRCYNWDLSNQGHFGLKTLTCLDNS